ncbi:MAG TPA: chemotaxis protein CheA [candidate division Zixibacteria bacterium]|nr:chemotaxis protein CheA [candidate division Zixibacteria bacterium]
MSDKFTSDLLEDFVMESREHLAQIEPGLLRMESDPSQPDQATINEVFRAVHSLKGAALFFGFNGISELSNLMESLLMKVRDGDRPLTIEMIDALLKANDKLQPMIEDLNNSDAVDIRTEVALLKNIMDETTEDAPLSQSNPAGEMSFLDEDNAGIPVEVDHDAIRKLTARGNAFYFIRYHVQQDIFKAGKLPSEIVDLLGSVGTILGTEPAIDRFPASPDEDSEWDYLKFMFATVLQEDFLLEGLDLRPTQVTEFSMKQLLELVVDLKKPEDEKGDSLQRDSGSISGASQEVSSKAMTGVERVDDTLRVSVSTLNRLMDLAGELVLKRNQLKQMAESVQSPCGGMMPLIQSLDLITSDLQSAIMSARMQPVSALFGRFPRVIRELSRKTGKQIDLRLNGGDVDVDKSIIEALIDPLTHLVRNAVDHALETPEERHKANKSPRGKITLRAFHRAGQVVIELEDDGRGIDPSAVKATALRRQLLPYNKLNGMSPEELRRLIFIPGFSTSNTITDLSGRGVGLDVVRNNVERIGGNVDLRSEIGSGTTFSLNLPLTLAIMPSQIVAVGNERYAVPRASLEEMVYAGGPNSKYPIETVGDRRILNLRGELIPLIDLGELLSGQEVNSSVRFSVTGNAEGQERRNVLILQSGADRFGLIVSRLLDSEEIVVKPLSSFVKSCRFYAGATILGDGQVAMILDVAGMSEIAGLSGPGGDRETASTAVMDVGNSSPASLLVFGYGDSQRCAVPIQQISRIDKIPREKIHTINGELFVERQGALVKLFLPHRFIDLPQLNEDESHYFIITPKRTNQPVGLVAGIVYDIAESTAPVNDSEVEGSGVMGALSHDGQSILLLDIHEMIEIMDRVGKVKAEVDEQPPTSRKVCLLECNPIWRAMITHFLSGCHQVKTCCNMEEAVEVIADWQPEVVILSPGRSHGDTIPDYQPLRESGISSMKVIALTSNPADTRSAALGADAVACRFDKWSLLEVIEKTLTNSGGANE